jgi:radical SAM superfamily enzyme YgiQ (UPF0313 family)
MRFLFITHGIEPASFQGPHWLPLGFAYIGALLKQHRHEVLVFDRYAAINRLGQNAEKIDQAMLDTVNDFQPDIIGLNTVSPMIYDTVHCARIIRNIFSSMMLAGGHHATALPLLTLEKIPELDGVGIGEGEESLLELAGGKKPEEIRGFIWRKSPGKESFGRMEELDKLPFPDFSLFDTNFYTRRASSTIRGFHLSTLSMLGSRGCLHRCSFCTESLTYGHGVRFHSMEYVTEMVNKTLKQYPHVEGIYFHDNDFMIDTARVEKICKKFIDTGLAKRFVWAIQARADRLEPKLLGLMRAAGCVKMEIGIEATAQKDLDIVKKCTTVNVNENALRLCREAGISVHAYILTKAQNESLEDLEFTLTWLKKNRPDTFSFSPLLRHPGSLLYKETGGQFFENNAWTRENVLRFYSEDIFSRVSEEDRKQWALSRMVPFYKRHHRVIRYSLNPLRKWPQMLYEALSRRIKALFEKS